MWIAQDRTLRKLPARPCGLGRSSCGQQGGMCQYKVRVRPVGEVDAELIGWIKMAFDAAG